MNLPVVLLLCLIASAFDPPPQLSDGQGPAEIDVLKLSWDRQVPPPLGWDRPDYNSSDHNPAGARSRRRGSTQERKPIYVYSMKIKNRGSRTITGVAWEYLVLDAGNNQEIGQHTFWSLAKIKADKSVTLEGKSPSPPSSVVSATAVEKDGHSPFLDRAVIKCVMYADGTYWKNPKGGDDDCVRLNTEAHRKQ